jgi:hypothetical protein
MFTLWGKMAGEENVTLGLCDTGSLSNTILSGIVRGKQ